VAVDVAEVLRAAIDSHPPVLIFLAGPNGAGKSTFYRTYLEALGIPFVNADNIRLKLPVRSPQEAAQADVAAFRTAEELRRVLLDARVSFCTETVFSDPGGAKLEFLKQAREAGYAVFLVFIGLESAALSTARVVQRVRDGGHDVPDEKLEKRFPRTLKNLPAAIPLVNEAYLFDNSSAEEPFRPVTIYRDGALVYRQAPTPGWAQGLPGL